MTLSGTFVMISVESREKDGKKYFNVNIEAEDGKLLRIGSNEQTVAGLQKYKKHQGWFDIGTFDGKMYMRLVDAAVMDGK